MALARHAPPIPRPEAPPEGLGPHPPIPQPALTPPEPSSARRRPHFPLPSPVPTLQDRPSTPGPLHIARRSPSSKGRGDLGGPRAQTGLRSRSPALRVSHRTQHAPPLPPNSPTLALATPLPPAAGNRKRRQGPAPPPAEARPRRLRPRPLSAPPPERRADSQD